jgi:hypothetical protein
MTQAALIKALQNGPLTSKEAEDLTGMSRSTVLSTAKKMRYKGDLSTEQVRIGRFTVARYTLAEHLIENKKANVPADKLNPFDIRNAQGIFSPTEYRIMNAQARNFYKGNPTFTTYSKAVSSENNRQV